MSLRVENSFRDLDERYRVLVVYNLCVSDMLFMFVQNIFLWKRRRELQNNTKRKTFDYTSVTLFSAESGRTRPGGDNASNVGRISS